MFLLVTKKVSGALSINVVGSKLNFMIGAFHYKGARTNMRSRVGAGEEDGPREEVEPPGEYFQD